MDIRKYISEVEKTYTYRIKTVIKLDDDAMGRIESAIMKYQPIKLSAPKKTMLQKNPLDFPTVQNAEVYIVDIELGLPASAYVLSQEVRLFLAAPEKFVVVRGDNEPLENETEALIAKNDLDLAAKEEGAVRGAMLNLPNYDEAEPVESTDYYGDQYNRRFLGYLKKVETERTEASKIETPNQKFGWLNMPKSDVEADAGPTIGTAEPGERNPKLSSQGNVDDDNKSYARIYMKKGNTYVKRQDSDSVRK